MPVNTANLGPGGTANQPGGLVHPTNFGLVSSATSGSAIQPVYAFSESSLGFYQSGASTVALSYGTLNLFTNANRFSMATVANPNGMNIGELKVVFAASGISLIYSSGASVYIVGQSAVSGAQP